MVEENTEAMKQKMDNFLVQLLNAERMQRELEQALLKKFVQEGAVITQLPAGGYVARMPNGETVTVQR
jgi:hypothetical protein